LVSGDQLLLDGRLVEIEGFESSLSFEGIENHGGLIIKHNEEKLSIRTVGDSVEAFFKIRTSFRLRPNDIIRVGLIRFEVHRFNHSSVSVQGIRPSMEDEDFARDGLNASHLSMFSVYDGHGGFDASKYLRSHFHKYFSATLENSQGDITSSLVEAFHICDRELLQIVKERGLSMGVGSVVNTVIIDEKGNFICANLGDCRAIIGLDAREIVELSRDLKPGLPEEIERIVRCGGFVSSGNRVNGRLAVSRAIGDFEYKSETGEMMVSSVPEVRVHKKTGKERFLIIACDGLYDVMSSREVVGFIDDRIASFLSKNIEPDPSQICVDLVTECVIKRGTSDNVTIILALLRPFMSI
jgi:protein phosphatase 2C family protein 2/3